MVQHSQIIYHKVKIIMLIKRQRTSTLVSIKLSPDKKQLANCLGSASDGCRVQTTRVRLITVAEATKLELLT